MNPILIPRQGAVPVDDKSFRKPGFAPFRLFRLRLGIHLRSIGSMLVRRRNLPAADTS
jgi:hypothetical protein